MCEGNNTKGDKPTTNLNIVCMSEGNMVNNNMTLGPANANLVTNLFTKGNNTNSIAIDTMCMGCCVPQKIDSLCHFTHSCPVTSANEFSNEHKDTEGPSSSEMLGVDGGKV